MEKKLQKIYSILFTILILNLFIANAEIDITSYFAEDRNFQLNPLTIKEVENFYEIWLLEQQGNIDDIALQSIRLEEGQFYIEFQRLENNEIFEHKVKRELPETLINSSMLNNGLQIYEGDLSIFSGRDFTVYPLTIDDINGFYEYSPQDENIIIKEIVDTGDYFNIFFIQKENKNIKSTKKIDKYDPKSLLMIQEPVSGRLVEFYPDFAIRNFNLWPLTIDEISDFYQKYRSVSSLNIRGNYIGAHYDKTGDIIYAQFKGALSGKIISRKIDPKNPNSLLKN